MSTTLYTNNGLVVFADGQVVYIESVQYSADGLTNWESTFNPNTHISTIDNVSTVAGHKYRRVKHAGDTNWQAPALYVPNDPAELEYQVVDGEFQVKRSDETTWTTIFTSAELKGEQGELGVSFDINRIGALDVRPAQPTSGSTGCTSCNPVATCSCGDAYIYVSIGNHIIATADTVGTQYHSLDGIVWTATTANYIGVPVFAWGASVNDGTGAYSCNSQGVIVALTSLIPPYTNLDSTGKVYAWDCTNLIWQEIYNFTVTTGQIKANSGDTLGFLESKVDTTSIDLNASDLLEVIDNGITTAKIANDAVVTAKILDGNITASKLASAVAGLGLLKDATSLYVNVDDDTLAISGDQVIIKNDGVDKTKINADVAGLGLVQAVGGELDVNVDDVTIEIATDTVQVKALGIDTAQLADEAVTIGKLATDIADTDRALDQDGSGLFVKVDATSIGYSSATKSLEVKADGITGTMLNDNTCDTNKGVEIDTNKIAVKIGTGVEFDGTGHVQVDESYITGLIGDITNLPTNDITSTASISVTGGTDAVLGSGNVTLSVLPAGIDHNSLANLATGDLHTQYILKTVIGAKGDLVVGTGSGSLDNLPVGTNTYVLTADSNEAMGVKWAAPSVPASASGTVTTLNGVSDAGVAATYSKGDHKHDFADASIAQSKVVDLIDDLAGLVPYDVEFNGGFTKINYTHGIMLKSPGGRWFKLVIADEAGNLNTVLVP